MAFAVFMLLPQLNLLAFPFPIQEARSAAMGGVGVAVGVPNAAFINPALMATDDEDFDWMVLLPSLGKVESDPDKLAEEISAYQRDLGTSNEPAAEQRLLAADGHIKAETESKTLSIVVPSEKISTVAFLNTRDFGSAKLIVDSTISSSVIEHRHVSITEQGVAIAKLLDDADFWFEDLMLGLNVKLSLIQAYGYSENIGVAKADLTSSEFSDNTGVINFDVGLAKEYGVWKIGFVVRDIFAYSHTYGDSGVEYKVRPQARLGFAYRSRKTLWGLDFDLTKNTEIVHQDKTQFVAMGIEYKVASGWHLRGGYRQNIVADGLATISAGMGIRIGGYSVDLAVFDSENETGTFGQFVAEF